ncbi:uncharacterized protein [Chelonus insularis]|uniref:uncharacterized protein n=1 Tax=Chelonus insularis TaxID=460826 RepID=UPI00158BF007|nr:uncharacterized protein LOC118068468 [Chelonus insularis]
MTNISAQEPKPIINGKPPAEKIGDQGGFFDVVVKPMFQHGHEGELCSWLKDTSLIRNVFSCPQPECEGKTLTWSGARIVDKYNWICPNCHKKQSIRDGSFFFGIKCDLKICLQLILAWCQNIPLDLAAINLNIKEHVVKKVYERCGQVAEFFVKSHPEEFQLGGPGVILLVDEFPGGIMSDTIPDNIVTTKKRNNNSHTILCITEASQLPPRMWLHVIQALPEPMQKNKNDETTKHRCGMVEEALKEIVQQVLPGSYLVTNTRARCCNYESLQELKQYGVFSIEYLQKFDGPDTNKLLNNLATIWQTGVAICEEIQESTRPMSQQIIATNLWKQRFGSVSSTAFQYMLNHIVECYRFT